MEEILEAAILAIILLVIILQNIFINRNANLLNNHIFNLNDFSDEQVKFNFRFERNDILRLVQVLQLPNEFTTNTRNKVTGLTGLCIVLRRLAYPNRLSDICSMFGLSAQSLSQIIIRVIEVIVENRGQLLNNLNTLAWLDRAKLQYYAEAIQNRGAPIPNCWGFIDGTARQICRPSMNQEEYYSGHKRIHCLKYQSVVCPDGIIVSLKGAFIGRKHDAGIFRESQLYNELEMKAVINNDEMYVLYGDQAYGIMELLISPFQGRNLAPHQLQFDRDMKTLRVSVEGGFQKVVSEFAFIDFRKNQKLLLQDVEAMYKTAVILTNCHTCLYGSQTATYFNTVPPTLQEYNGVKL